MGSSGLKALSSFRSVSGNYEQRQSLSSVTAATVYPTTFGESMNKTKSDKKQLAAQQREEVLSTLKARFEKNMHRHKGLEWAKVQEKLETNAEKVWSLSEMERSGGEPDVVSHDKKTGEYTFYDCSAESPKGRRSVCY